MRRYIQAWNDHDPPAVVAALTPGGTYQDPTTAGPLTGEAFARNVADLVAAFPDVRFEEISLAATSETAGAMQWVMYGTNTGPLAGGPPTGSTIALPGADFVDYDPSTDRLHSVTGYFDAATMFRQLGLQAHITPADMPPVTQFGYSVRIDTQRAGEPGAFTVTWIDVDDDRRAALQQATQAIVLEQLGNAGYLGSCFSVIGRRNYTFSAWTSTEAVRQALRGGRHAEAMRTTSRGGLGDNAFGVTSIWEPTVMNAVFRVGRHRSEAEDGLTGQWL
jgi:steroid delta-isomerase-like uncharacterized protein